VRLIGQGLSERLGQPFVIENRPGAGTNIATETVVKAPPDGHTLLLSTISNAFNASLYDKLSFNFVSDIAPVAGIARAPNIMEVSPSFPAKSVPEFIANAKANLGKVNFASGGNGSTQQIFAELFKTMTGVNMVHVPFRGSPQAITDLLAGQVQVIFDPLPSSIEFVRSGKLRALAVTSATRSEALPDIPTVSEFVPGYEGGSWVGIGAPKNTSAEIIDTLNKEINVVLADPKIREQIFGLGAMPLPLTPAQYGKLIVDETDKWGKVIRTANIKVE
jgi:tripartite-type tricarboxylate transporter receptor subunit TctC